MADGTPRIFINSIVEGSVAARDGRIHINDQIIAVCVGQISLLIGSFSTSNIIINYFVVIIILYFHRFVVFLGGVLLKILKCKLLTTH